MPEQGDGNPIYNTALSNYPPQGILCALQYSMVYKLDPFSLMIYSSSP